MNQTQPPAVQAVPAMYIDVVINGQKQIYDIPTAVQLRDALNLALQPVDQIAAQEHREADDETQGPNGKQSPDDQVPQVPETDALAADVAADPDA